MLYLNDKLIEFKNFLRIIYAKIILQYYHNLNINIRTKF